MKKILLLALIVFAAKSAFAANEVTTMTQEFQAYHNKCFEIARNFNDDHQFSNYLKNKCLLFESDRTRMVASVFPQPNNVTEEYRKNYPALKAKFIADLNKRELANYKAILTEYCKYNKYKFEKNSPQACTPERINALFN